MTDHFALLGQPRQPWLDLEKLRQRYHQLSLTTHPDRASDEPTDEAAFTGLKEAYRVLSTPKLRLQHLLQLEGKDESTPADIPSPLLELFNRVGEFIARANQFLQRKAQAETALARSLLQAGQVALQKESEALLSQTTKLLGEAEEKSRALNDCWQSQTVQLGELCSLFAYLSRWIAQLEEWKFRLDNS